MAESSQKIINPWTEKHETFCLKHSIKGAAQLLWYWLIHYGQTGKQVEPDLSEFNQWVEQERGKAFCSKHLKNTFNKLLECGVIKLIKQYTWRVFKLIVKPLDHPVTSDKGGAGNLIVEYSLKKEVVNLVGATNCQLVSTKPANSSPISRRSLVRFTAVLIKWYAGDDTVTKERTPWNTTWLKKYDKNSTLGPSHFSLPFGGTDSDTLDAVIARFITLFNLTSGTKK